MSGVYFNIKYYVEDNEHIIIIYIPEKNQQYEK